MHALSILFRALLEPGDEVIVPTPCYFFGGLIERAGGVFVPVPGVTWDPEAVRRAVTTRSRAIVLTNPNNPTGYLPLRAEVNAILEFASRHDLTVVTDEAYERCIHDGELASAWGAPNVVLVRSLGKSLALPSWRIGFVAGEPDVVDACLRELEWDVIRVSHVAQRTAQAALEGPQDWLDALAARYRADRDAAHALIADDPILNAPLPSATPFLWLDLGGIPVQNLLAAGIGVVDGTHFGAPGHARLPFAGATEHEAELRHRLALVTLP
jgi:aspartate/methionine/tyrosine aminotransferase